MRRHLVDRPTEVQALRDFVRRTYGPRLAALGTTPRADDSDDDRQLRQRLVSALAGLGRDPALRGELATRGRQALGLSVDGRAGDGRWHADAVPIDQRALALRITMEDGDAEVFDALLGFVRTSKDPEQRSDLLAAAGAATQPALRARARELALAGDTVRRNEVWSLLAGSWRDAAQHVDLTPALRNAARSWLDTHFDALASRVAPYGASLVMVYADGLCSTADADAMAKRFATRMRTIEGGSRALAQTVEQVRLCGALRARQRSAEVGGPGATRAGASTRAIGG
jgi:alanyl aminopeptidase